MRSDPSEPSPHQPPVPGTPQPPADAPPVADEAIVINGSSRFSNDLRELLKELDGRGITIGDLESSMKGRGFALLIVILCVPFIQPVYIPLLSVPFGIAITLIGGRLIFGKDPWLPPFIRRRKLEPRILRGILRATAAVSSRIEKLIAPRLDFLFAPHTRPLIGLGIAWSGLILTIPWPPFVLGSNWLPAAAIFLLALGLMERDGIFVAIGQALAFITTLYLACWCYFSGKAIVIAYQEGMKGIAAYFSSN